MLNSTILTACLLKLLPMLKLLLSIINPIPIYNIKNSKPMIGPPLTTILKEIIGTVEFTVPLRNNMSFRKLTNKISENTQYRIGMEFSHIILRVPMI